MSSYNELIKNFEKIRSYAREFYVYGFKNRNEYDGKSGRSYDDERRRLESWLYGYMNFTRTKEGKNVYISIDSRAISHNPLYKAFKTKSFTDGDITLHFIIFDILYSPEISLTLNDISLQTEKYFSSFENPLTFDESTLRKKLNEYEKIGLIVKEKRGKSVFYRREKSVDVSNYREALNYFSEVLPLGVVGSFLLDKVNDNNENFSFKHHYITSALDSNELYLIFLAIREKKLITFKNYNNKSVAGAENTIAPLKVYVSAQNGRQYVIGYSKEHKTFKPYRLDYISCIKIGDTVDDFNNLRAQLLEYEKYMWGVNIHVQNNKPVLERVEFIVKAERGEEYIINRLQREKRIGKVEKVGDFTYKFSAEVFDSSELIPWIRTFICRIIKLNFSNRTRENAFKKDIIDTYRLYGLTGEGEYGI
jgi:hypothetical protein